MKKISIFFCKILGQATYKKVFKYAILFQIAPTSAYLRNQYGNNIRCVYEKKAKIKKICNEFDYQKEPVQEINCSRRLEKPELMRPSIWPKLIILKQNKQFISLRIK